MQCLWWQNIKLELKTGMRTHYIYVDASNLYCCAMFEYFLIGRFRYIKPKEFDMNKYACNISKSCVLEVDVGYPKKMYNIW